jgi:hypothetical protein
MPRACLFIAACLVAGGPRAAAATETEMAELMRLLRIAAPHGGTVVATGIGASAGEPEILASLTRGDDGQAVVTLAFQSRVGLMTVGEGAPDSGPGACDIVLQDTNADGVADMAEFHCDRISKEMPKALSQLRQPMFDAAVRAIIRRLATV